MNNKRTAMKTTAIAVASAMTMASLPIGAAQAGLVSTEAMVHQTDAATARAQVQQLMSRDDVRAEMQAQGVDPAEAQARIDALSDAEVMRLAGQIDALPAGQSAVGAIVGAAVIVFIVLLITDIAGFTNVFSFVN